MNNPTREYFNGVRLQGVEGSTCIRTEFLCQHSSGRVRDGPQEGGQHDRLFVAAVEPQVLAPGATWWDHRLAMTSPVPISGDNDAADPVLVRYDGHTWPLVSGRTLTFGRGLDVDINLAHEPPDLRVSRHTGTLRHLIDTVLIINASSRGLLTLQADGAPPARSPRARRSPAIRTEKFRICVIGDYGSSYNLDVDANALPAPASEGHPNRGEGTILFTRYDLTPGQRRVLSALCAPLFAGETRSATNPEIAASLNLQRNYVRNVLKETREKLAAQGVPGLLDEENPQAGEALRQTLAQWALRNRVGLDLLRSAPGFDRGGHRGVGLGRFLDRQRDLLVLHALGQRIGLRAFAAYPIGHPFQQGRDGDLLVHPAPAGVGIAIQDLGAEGDVLGVVADEIEVVAGLSTDQGSADQRARSGHPDHLVIVQFAGGSAHGEPTETQLVAGLLLGEVVEPGDPPPKSRVAIVLTVGCGSSSSVHPARLNGLTNGAVNRVARTVTGPRPAPSRPRISETAWYSWVEVTCTWVGVPMAPPATRAARAACDGIIRYCSATWTSPDPPTRRPQLAKTREIGGRRGLGQHGQSAVDRLGDHARASPTAASR